MSNLLEVRDLVVRFGDSFSVGPVSFDIGVGVLLLAGPNGGGKTTLMRAIAGELQPSSGDVFVSGENVRRSVEARRQVSLVPSASELPDFLSVAEAYEFAAAIRGFKYWSGSDYLSRFDLDPDLPLGSASAGQRRKAELVCGLAGDPSVLLLDETFAHLDDKSANQLMQWVTEWRETRLVVYTHHGEPPVSADATLFVERGRVEFE